MDSLRLLHRVAEAAAKTGYSKAFIYEKVRAGELRRVKNGRSIRIADEDLRAWIAAHTVGRDEA